MRKFIPLLLLFLSPCAHAAGGTCPTGANYLQPNSETTVTLSTLGVTSCFYISKATGSDTNTGTTEGSPWAHLPGMPDCTNNCSITPAPGEGFILKGGDTWTASDLNADWAFFSSGTSSHPIYVGTDQTWFNSGVCGASFCRPIWSCGGTACSQTSDGNCFFVDSGGLSYIIIDDIEMTGLYQNNSASPCYVAHFGSNETAERLYLHGWSHVAGLTNNSSSGYSSTNCCGGGSNNVFRDSVVDGSDTAKDMLVCMDGVYEAYNDICRYTTDGLTGQGTDLHNNWFGPLVLCAVSGGCHQNAIQAQGPIGSTQFIYNNVITQLASGGMGELWILQSSPSGTAAYVFGNIEFNTAVGNNVNVCQLAGSCGPIWIFNNTFECGSDSNTGDCMAGTNGATQTVHWINNHCITSTSCVTASWSGLTISYGASDPFKQSVVTASGQGYTSTSTYAFQPTVGTGGTVGAGVNEQSLCTTIAGLNSVAGTACQNDTGYACNYNTSNHTVSCPDRTENARPASAVWDIGAYQFVGGPNLPAPAASMFVMVGNDSLR